MISNQNKLINSWIVFLIVLTPILSQYAFPFAPSIVLSDWVFLIVLITTLLKENPVLYPRVLLFPFYVLLRQSFVMLYGVGEMDATKSAFHYLVYYIVGALVLPTIDSIKQYEKYIHYVAIFATAFLLLQILVHSVTRYYISGTIPFLVHDPVLDLFASSMNGTALLLRPRSIFFEPSHYGSYMSVALAFCLQHYQEKVSTKLYMRLAIFYTLGMGLSFSSTAIALALAMWGCFFTSKTKITKKGVFVFIGVAILLVFLMRTEWFQAVITRTFDNSNGHSALNNRIGNISSALKEHVNSIWRIVFGSGVFMKAEFIPEAVYLFQYWGILGIISYFTSIIPFFLPFRGCNRMIAILCILLSVIGGSLCTSNAPFFMVALAISGSSQVTQSTNSVRSRNIS